MAEEGLEMIDDETLECWRINYNLHLDPHELSKFWRSYAPTGAVLALKAAVEEIERLRAALAHFATDETPDGWVAISALAGDEDELTAQIIVVEEQIKEVDRELMAVRGASRDAPALEEKLSWQKKQRELENKRSTLRRELFRLMDLESE